MKSGCNASRVLIFCTGICLMVTSACTRYYMPVPAEISTAEKLQMAVDTNTERYFILRQGPKFYSLSQVAVDTTHQQLTGYLDQISTDHLTYLKAKRRQYGQSNDFVENEVHIYSADTTIFTSAQNIALPLQDILKVEIIERDSKRTSTSTLIGVGATVGVIGIILGISAATYSIDLY